MFIKDLQNILSEFTEGKKGNTIVTDEARKKKIVCTAEVCTSCT